MAEEVISRENCFQPEKLKKLENRLISPEGFTLSTPKKSKNQAKNKKKMQVQSRRKNCSPQK
ncbi:hypothetical protein [Nostoc sp. C052]|uniref:hypothetical protein n=1 Tax=Nostoc sp. C052 TaxID=2576902 RepID=UPI002118FA68|nr:hypothetical protein [Nostoc sp. C052]